MQTASSQPSSVLINERFPTLEYDGILYEKGTPIAFKGQKGNFTFWSWERNPKTGAEWVNVWEVNRCHRAFRIYDIKKPKAKKVKKGVAQAGLCNVHKQYTAQRKPRTDCLVCWDAYNDKHDR